MTLLLIPLLLESMVYLRPAELNYPRQIIIFFIFIFIFFHKKKPVACPAKYANSLYFFRFCFQVEVKNAFLIQVKDENVLKFPHLIMDYCEVFTKSSRIIEDSVHGYSLL